MIKETGGQALAIKCNISNRRGSKDKREQIDENNRDGLFNLLSIYCP